MDRLAFVVAAGVLTLAALTAVYVLMFPIPEQNETLVGQMLGALWSSLGMVVGYFFGSTRSSSKKDDTIANLSKSKSEEP